MLQTAIILVALSMADMNCLVRRLWITPQAEVPPLTANSNLSYSVFTISHTVISHLMFKDLVLCNIYSRESPDVTKVL